MDGLKGCDVPTDRQADPNMIVNIAESAFQILAPQPSQSVPSILSRPSFIAKPNSPCRSEVPGSCSVRHHYCESLFCPNPNWGVKHTKKETAVGQQHNFLGALLENNTFLLLIYIIPRSWMPTGAASNSLILLAQWRELDSRKKPRLHGGLAVQNSAWLEVNHSLNLLKQLWRAFILFYGSLNRRASLEIWASLSRQRMLSEHCRLIERWEICQNKCRNSQVIPWQVRKSCGSFFCTDYNYFFIAFSQCN